MAKRKKQSKVQKRGKLPKSAKRPKARKAKAAKRMVAKAKPKSAPAKKAVRKQPVAPVVETVAVEVIGRHAPGVINGTVVEETPGSGLQRALKRMNPNR